jgi:predicted DNA binding protein
MSLVVEYREYSPHLQITDTAAAVPEMDLTVERWQRTGDDLLSLYLRARGDDFERLEVAFDDQENLQEFRVITDDGAARLYRLTVVSTIDHLPAYSSVDGFVEAVEVEPDGLYVTGYLPDRASLVEAREFMVDRGMDMEVLSLREATADPPDTELTTEQLEAVVTAYEMGYFDVPKKVTQADVAEELGISPPSVSERLKRASQRLVERHIEARVEQEDAA